MLDYVYYKIARWLKLYKYLPVGEFSLSLFELVELVSSETQVLCFGLQFLLE